MDTLIEKLLASDEPCVQYKIRVGVLGESPASAGVRRLRRAVRDCPRVRTLLSEVGADGRIPTHPYNKWRGAHWVLAQLADLGYPPGDKSLAPLIDHAAEWALGIKATMIDGRPRRCASQQGYALLYMLALGFGDARCHELAERLIGWQWGDGGWNCDKKPKAHCSSVHESLIPFRALAAYARWSRDKAAAAAASAAAERAAESFLRRRLLWRVSTGELIRPRFALLSYPYYWHYGLLAALRAMADAGRIGDPRCADALDLLESKRLPGGRGWAMEVRHYDPYSPIPGSRKSGASLVRWGRGGKNTPNEFVTAEALGVLHAAGRA
jgi:hypothetical protein